MKSAIQTQEEGAGVRPRRGIRAAFFFSLCSLIFSGVSLYETVLKQPKLTTLAGCNWQYGRGPGSNDEFFVVPVTIANHGARSGAVISIELTAQGGGESKIFEADFTLGSVEDKTEQLFAPLAIPGRQSATSSIKFVQKRLTNPPLVGADGQYRATLKLRTSMDSSYGAIDRLLVDPAPEASFDLSLKGFDLGAVLNHARANIGACGTAPKSQQENQ